jgi:hypothetical protein
MSERLSDERLAQLANPTPWHYHIDMPLAVSMARELLEARKQLAHMQHTAPCPTCESQPTWENGGWVWVGPSERFAAMMEVLRRDQKELAERAKDTERLSERLDASKRALEAAKAAIWDAHYGNGIAAAYARQISDEIDAAMSKEPK